MMSALYSNVPYLNSPLTLTEEGWIDLDDNRIIEHTENDEKYWNKEVSRIYGYERDVKQEVNIENVYNPTKEELDLFNRLTPAQKILWIQINLTEDKGIFDFLKVNSVNQYQIKRKGFSQETIRFSDDVENMQEIYIAFNNSFFNTSPIIRSATIDLIKYAFISDGFKFKKGGLSKIITNNSMYKDIDDMGMNLIPVIRNIFQFYSNPAEAVTTEFIDKFIRSHSEYVRTLRLGKAQNKNGQMNLSARFNIYSQKNGLIFIPFEDRAKELLSEINIKNIEKYKEGIENTQSYIRVIQTRSKNTKINTLYKLRKTANGVYLIPLNLLERNETGDYSVNPNNNRYPDITYFNSIIDDAEDQNVQTKELTNGENEEQTEKYKTLRKESIIPAYKFTKGSQSTENENEFRRILENGTAIEKAEMQKFMQDVADYVNTPVENKGKYILVRSNNKSIFNEVPKNKTITQNIIVGDDIVSVNITRSKQPKKFANSIKFRKKLDINEIPIEQRAAYLNAFDGGIIQSNYYKVTINVNEDVKNEIEKQDKEIQDDSKIILNAITSDATDYYVNNSDQLTVVDTTAIDIIKTLKKAERYGDKNADKVRRILESRHINEYRSKDIIDNRKNIYGALAQYIELTADMLNKQINHYRLNDEEYSLGDDNLYNALREYPENAEEIVKLLLEAITFWFYYVIAF